MGNRKDIGMDMFGFKIWLWKSAQMSHSSIPDYPLILLSEVAQSNRKDAEKTRYMSDNSVDWASNRTKMSDVALC